MSDRKEFWQNLERFADDFISGYEFRGDDGDYSPSEKEQFLIEDCVAGLLHEMDQEGFFRAQGEEAVGRTIDMGDQRFIDMDDETLNGLPVDTKLYTHPAPSQAVRSGTGDALAALESVKKRIERNHIAMAPTARVAVRRVFEAIRLEAESRTPMFSTNPPTEGEGA